MSAKAVSTSQLHALAMIATMGDVSVDPRRRKGLDVREHTLKALVRMGLIQGGAVEGKNADGTSKARDCWVLTDEGMTVMGIDIPPKEPKPQCEVKTHFCSGALLARWKGAKKSDPEFVACGACIAILRRSGIKVKQIVGAS